MFIKLWPFKPEWSCNIVTTLTCCVVTSLELSVKVVQSLFYLASSYIRQSSATVNVCPGLSPATYNYTCWLTKILHTLCQGNNLTWTKHQHYLERSYTNDNSNRMFPGLFWSWNFSKYSAVASGAANLLSMYNDVALQYLVIISWDS